MKTVHLMHKAGGRITAIHSIEHETFKGVADWFYRGDIEWKDGGSSDATRIPPWAVCFDHDVKEANAEYATISEKMIVYLSEHGNWHDGKQKKDGRIVFWTPKNKQFSVAL